MYPVENFETSGNSNLGIGNHRRLGKSVGASFEILVQRARLTISSEMFTINFQDAAKISWFYLILGIT